MYGLYFKGATKASAYVSFILGTVIMTLNLFFRGSFPVVLQSPINAGAFVMILGLIVVPLVSLFTKKPDRAKVDEMFSCYEQKVTVAAKEALGDE